MLLVLSFLPYHTMLIQIPIPTLRPLPIFFSFSFFSLAFFPFLFVHFFLPFSIRLSMILAYPSLSLSIIFFRPLICLYFSFLTTPFFLLFFRFFFSFPFLSVPFFPFIFPLMFFLLHHFESYQTHCFQSSSIVFLTTYSVNHLSDHAILYYPIRVRNLPSITSYRIFIYLLLFSTISSIYSAALVILII